MSYPLSGAERGTEPGEVAWIPGAARAGGTSGPAEAAGSQAAAAGDSPAAASVTVLFRAHHAELVRLAVQRRLGDTSEVNTAPDFLALSQDGSGQYFMLNIGLCAGNCTDGANGWIHDGRLVPLQPADGREADQAW